MMKILSERLGLWNLHERTGTLFSFSVRLEDRLEDERLDHEMTNSHDPNVRSKIRAAHGQLHSFFDSTREALGGDEAKMACGQLHNALETHFAQEEILYFPALWQLRPDLEPTLRGLIAFHAGFLERLDEIARMIDAGARTEAEAAFVELQRLFALHEAGEEEAMRSLD